MLTERDGTIVVDGSYGEGGGQIIRSSLTLAMCLGRRVVIENIRAGRKKPGLLRQHLTCLRAAKEICNAEVHGDELRSNSVLFSPGKVRSGKYRFTVGSAGSTSLVFQTVLLPLLMVEGASEVTLEGGTHNPLAPSFEFLADCFLPAIRKLGYVVEAELEEYGFFPAGGGRWTVQIGETGTLKTLKLLDSGREINRSATAISAIIPEHVNERELKQVGKRKGWQAGNFFNKQVSSAGPGNILSLKLEMENHTEVIDQLGEVRTKAERVADKACVQADRYMASAVPVGEYLADQLILPLVLGSGGVFRTGAPSLHLTTNVQLVKQFSGVDIRLSEVESNCWEVQVPA